MSPRWLGIDTLNMDVYIVTYKMSFPGANEYSDQDLTKTAFVLAESFKDAQEKVEKRFKKDFGSGLSEGVSVIAISRGENGEVIIV